MKYSRAQKMGIEGVLRKWQRNELLVYLCLMIVHLLCRYIGVPGRSTRAAIRQSYAGIFAVRQTPAHADAQEMQSRLLTLTSLLRRNSRYTNLVSQNHVSSSTPCRPCSSQYTNRWKEITTTGHCTSNPTPSGFRSHWLSPIIHRSDFARDTRNVESSRSSRRVYTCRRHQYCGYRAIEREDKHTTRRQ